MNKFMKNTEIFPLYLPFINASSKKFEFWPFLSFWNFTRNLIVNLWYFRTEYIWNFYTTCCQSPCVHVTTLHDNFAAISTKVTSVTLETVRSNKHFCAKLWFYQNKINLGMNNFLRIFCSLNGGPWFHFTQGCFVSSLVKLDLYIVVLEKGFQISSMFICH